MLGRIIARKVSACQRDVAEAMSKEARSSIQQATCSKSPTLCGGSRRIFFGGMLRNSPIKRILKLFVRVKNRLVEVFREKLEPLLRSGPEEGPESPLKFG